MTSSSSSSAGLSDALVLGECMSNEKKISPVWLRVSTTPWEISAKKICGYGRPIKNISLSDQMPPEFKRTEHLAHSFGARKGLTSASKLSPGLEAAHVLPGGHNILKAQPPKHGHSIKKYHYQKQVIMEPQQTGRPNDRVRMKFDPPRVTQNAYSQSSRTSAVPLSPVRHPSNISVSGGKSSSRLASSGQLSLQN